MILKSGDWRALVTVTATVARIRATGCFESIVLVVIVGLFVESAVYFTSGCGDGLIW